MKKLFSLVAMALVSTVLFAQTSWKSDLMHSKLTFGVTHLAISEVEGLFKNFDATVAAGKEDFSDAIFDLSVNVASVNTEVEMRDNHLRSADFFEVEKYPTMHFKSNSIRKESKDKYILTGNLTLRGITKPVTMKLWYRGTTINPMSKATTAGFQLTGTINRSDFTIGPKYPSPMLSEEVNIKADGEFIKQ